MSSPISGKLLWNPLVSVTFELEGCFLQSELDDLLADPCFTSKYPVEARGFTIKRILRHIFVPEGKSEEEHNQGEV